MLSDWLAPITSDARFQTPQHVLLVTPKFRDGCVDTVANIEQLGASSQHIVRQRYVQLGQARD